MSESRTLTELGGVWDFRTAGAEDYPEAFVTKPLEKPMAMAVPASYNDQRDDVNLRDHYGWVVYQRRFTVPRPLMGQRIVLRFGAVTHKAVVYLNGKQVGTHTGGFLPF